MMMMSMVEEARIMVGLKGASSSVVDLLDSQPELSQIVWFAIYKRFIKKKIELNLSMWHENVSRG